MNSHYRQLSPPSTEFVRWFRGSSPYIHAHRNRTFVIFFGGEALGRQFANLIHDFALLKSLGIRLVIVHGIRPQIDARLRREGIEPSFHNNMRITDSSVLQIAKECAGLVRLETEALLSMGLSNSPMAEAKIKVASGNFVTAKPLGVIDGIDFGFTGVVRRIDNRAIHQQLDHGNVVLVSPIGFSPSGEMFNINAEQIATEIAVSLSAEKLILLTEEDCVLPGAPNTVKQMTTLEAERFIRENRSCSQAVTRYLTSAIESNRRGVSRVHLVNRHTDGALLLELFSRDGSGTLVSAEPFEEIRSARLDDIGGILELIQPLEQSGQLVKRSREKLEMAINDFIVIERDGLILACIALHCFNTEPVAEIACLAVHPDYRGESRGSLLLEHLTDKAKKLSIDRLYALSTQTMHWFVERGFLACEVDQMPDSLKNFYNFQRNSKVFVKEI